MDAYSMDLRERVARACDESRLQRKQIASLFGVSTAWIRRLLQRRRETGSLAPRPHAGGSSPSLDDEQRLELSRQVAAKPDVTLAELRERLGVTVHVSTISRVLSRLGLTRKKSRFMPLSKIARTCSDNARNGGIARQRSTRHDSSSSTRRGRTPP